jgi:hypothetical protein
VNFVELHDEAMALVDKAREVERTGDKNGSTVLLREAYRLEREAAGSLDAIADSEPTRTVLFRSAASLAFQAEDYQEACNLAFDGLTGNSPEEHTTELLEIASDAKFRSQLISQNFRVSTAQVTVILRGPRVSIGLAPARQTASILGRVEALLRMRVDSLFRDKIGAAGMEWPVGNAKQFDVFMRPLAAEEFAVSFQLGIHEQLSLFGTASPGDRILGDFMRDLQKVISGHAVGAELEKFSAAVGKLEPDGKEVTSIEITSVVSGKLISVRIPPKKGPMMAGGEDGQKIVSLG